MSEISFYQAHLDRVSRSFAFCIARLEGEMREWVSLSYLLCRILDTVEDAHWSSPEAQAEAFESFRSFLENPPTATAVQTWAASFPSAIPTGEAELLLDAHRCFANFHTLAPGVREKIRRPVMNMYRGMRHFLATRPAGAAIRLHTLAEVNQYCFFVAGLVGELLTELVSVRSPGFARAGVYRDAHHFGLFLQKINLLKDQAGDEKEGRFLVPSRPELLASLAKDAEGAIRYIQALPVAEKGFRLFCAWSLFLGLASLPWIEKSKRLGAFLKIPRLVTERLLGRVENVIDDNAALLALFRRMLPALPAVVPIAMSGGGFAWFSGAYREGSLSAADFRSLGMLPE